jgi:hypothetical protein
VQRRARVRRWKEQQVGGGAGGCHGGIAIGVHPRLLERVLMLPPVVLVVLRMMLRLVLEG